jgi:hypothetical protein
MDHLVQNYTLKKSVLENHTSETYSTPEPLTNLKRSDLSTKLLGFKTTKLQSQLIHIFAQLAAIYGVQSFRLLGEHVNQAVGQLLHQRG